MKITRSALKSLIKEEMNRINEGDESTVHPYSFDDLSEDLKEPFTMTMAQLGEAGAILSDPISVSWPIDRGGKMAPISMITLIRPKSEAERKSVSGRDGVDKVFTGVSSNNSLIDAGLAMNLIAHAVEKTRPELWALIVKAKEGARLIKKGKAEFVSGGWALLPDDTRGTGRGMTQDPGTD
jgi:hypothetical protein